MRLLKLMLQDFYNTFLATFSLYAHKLEPLKYDLISRKQAEEISNVLEVTQ